jgi:hypothetical protein
LQRFLPVYLKAFGLGQDDYPDEELDKKIADLARVISQAEPRRFKFAPEADAERVHIEEFALEQKMRSDGLKFKEWLGKLPNEFARIALTFHYSQWAALPSEQRGVSPPDLIPLETAIMARRFLKEFIFPHAREFYRSMVDQSPSEDHVTGIAEYILSRDLSTITERDVYRSQKALKGASKAGLRAHAMSLMEMEGWLKPVGYRKDGRACKWEVNPKVHAGRFKEIADREKKRRPEVRATIASGGGRC